MLVLVCALVGMDCSEEDEPSWEQYNAEDDSVDIEVGLDEETEDVTTELHSNVVEQVIGSASVSPGGGPIGTTHFITVVVEDEWENHVGRVTVRTDSGERGEDEYELEADMSDEGAYGLEIVSVGEEGEQRTDTLTFRLWYDDEDSTSSGDDTGSR